MRDDHRWPVEPPEKPKTRWGPLAIKPVAREGYTGPRAGLFKALEPEPPRDLMRHFRQPPTGIDWLDALVEERRRERR